MRLRPAMHSPHLFDRQRHPAPMLTVHKAARQANYFQTGNVPQRCTTANIRAPCFASAHQPAAHQSRQHGNNATRKYRAGKWGIKFRNAREDQNANVAQKKTRNRQRPMQRTRPRVMMFRSQKRVSVSCAWQLSSPCPFSWPLF
jgi:hypothetical protein